MIIPDPAGVKLVPDSAFNEREYCLNIRVN
jgi:hypothetical protein